MCSIQTIVTPSAFEPADRPDEDLDLGLGEPAGDLVEQQQARPDGEGARQLEALAIEQRQRAGDRVGPAEQAGPGRGPRRTRVEAARRGSDPAYGADQDVLEDGHPAERAGDLVRAADADPARAWAGSVVMSAPSSRIRPRSGGRLPLMRLSIARLAGPVRADDAEHLARLDAVGQVVGDDDLSERLRDALELEERRHRAAATGRGSARDRLQLGPARRDLRVVLVADDDAGRTGTSCPCPTGRRRAGSWRRSGTACRWSNRPCPTIVSRVVALIASRIAALSSMFGRPLQGVDGDLEEGVGEADRLRPLLRRSPPCSRRRAPWPSPRSATT